MPCLFSTRTPAPVLASRLRRRDTAAWRALLVTGSPDEYMRSSSTPLSTTCPAARNRLQEVGLATSQIEHGPARGGSADAGSKASPPQHKMGSSRVPERRSTARKRASSSGSSNGLTISRRPRRSARARDPRARRGR